ncbi:MAG: Lrp/AsnC family transcriptional regulator [Rhodospirillales bacterium]|nr:Lrp/AsnC family transcriptional regulator [Rhodospirillales bacterium]
MTGYTALEKNLLDGFQRDFPLVSRPFQAIAQRLGVGEDDVIETLKRLKAEGAVSRVGAVVRPNKAGASTLAAMRVPPERLDEVAERVSAYPEVNHNYRRDHAINLWFVVAAPSRARLDQVLSEIKAQSGLPVFDLPMQAEYHIDLGFDLAWS